MGYVPERRRSISTPNRNTRRRSGPSVVFGVALAHTWAGARSSPHPSVPPRRVLRDGDLQFHLLHAVGPERVAVVGTVTGTGPAIVKVCAAAAPRSNDSCGPYGRGCHSRGSDSPVSVSLSYDAQERKDPPGFVRKPGGSWSTSCPRTGRTRDRPAQRRHHLPIYAADKLVPARAASHGPLVGHQRHRHAPRGDHHLMRHGKEPVQNAP